MPHDPVSRFWENFIEKTKAYSLKPATVRWHVRHAEAYIKAHSGRRLAEHTAEDIAAYLQEKGRNGRLAERDGGASRTHACAAVGRSIDLLPGPRLSPG